MLDTTTYRVEEVREGLYDVYNLNEKITKVLTFNELPDAIVERLSVLRMMRDPPTEPIDGVGQRVRDNLYWIEV